MSGSSVLVVGGGPAGSSAAYWLARAGHEVVLVEKKEYPRDKTCGDGLTPRAIYQLDEMGFDFDVPEFHKITGLRSYAGDDVVLEMNWPDHSRFPNWGGVIRRRDLDQQVARLAEKEGVVIREKTTATPVIEGRAAHLGESVQRRWIGGRHFPTSRSLLMVPSTASAVTSAPARRKDYPMGLAARGYYSSPRSDDPFLESQLDLRDYSGATIARLWMGLPAWRRDGQCWGGVCSPPSRGGNTSTTTHMMNDYAGDGTQVLGV